MNFSYVTTFSRAELSRPKHGFALNNVFSRTVFFLFPFPPVKTGGYSYLALPGQKQLHPIAFDASLFPVIGLWAASKC
jgi:hypothetical protein